MSIVVWLKLKKFVFVKEGSKVMISPQKQKLPKKQEQKQKQKDIEDNQLNNYIQLLAKM